jgi:ATP synthase protein I
MNKEHDEHQKLRAKVRSSAKKFDKAKKERRTLLAQMAYLGTVGVIFILPVIIGAYLGVWLDNKLRGFSVSWTISLILLGVIIGAINVYLFIKE